MRRPYARDDESDDGSDAGVGGDNYNIDTIGNDIIFQAKSPTNQCTI